MPISPGGDCKIFAGDLLLETPELGEISASGCPPVTAGAGTLLQAGRDPLALVLRRHLAGPCGFSGGGLVAAVSGGGDSMALMHLLAALADRGSGRGAGRGVGEVVVAHIDHGLRPESAAEGDLVAAAAAAIGLRCERRRILCGDPPGVAARARRERYRGLEAVAREVGAVAVVTAHQADDQLENLLISLGRGRAARGMAWSRGLGDGVRLLRPLLGVPRRSLREFCERLGLPYRDDPGNADPRTLRGRIRTTIAAEFESIWPGAARRAAAAAEDAALGAAAIERWLAECFGGAECRRWSRASLGTLPPSLLAAGLRRALHAADPEAARRLARPALDAAIEAIRGTGPAPRAWRWSRGWRLQIDAREVRLDRSGR
jgi:tRNA(Ile)-lysidine synthase